MKTDAAISHLDDRALVSQIDQRSHEAFATLVRRHSNRFYGLAYRLVSNRNDAEDIVQEAFLKIWDRPKLWDPDRGTKFTTWFYTVVIHLCFDHNKKKKPLRLPEAPELTDKNPGQEAMVDAHQKQALLERYIRELPERQQLALNLCFYEGLSHREAARIVGVKVKALQSLLMRAKATLKKKVNQYLLGGAERP